MARVGPTKGPRIPVQLPFAEGKTAGGKPAGKIILMKQEAAKALGFKILDKIPRNTVKAKVGVGNKEVSIERIVYGSYRQRSVKLIFKTKKTISGKQYKSVSMPLCSGVTIPDVVGYFDTGAGKNEGVVALITPHGRKIQWGEVQVGR